jgi:lysophospholipase L1-like esterase
MKLAHRLIAALSLACSAFAQAEPFPANQRVAFLGDSITAQGWSNLHGYVRLVVAGCDVNGMKIDPIPAGIGGHTSDDMLARLKRDVLDKKPDWVTISCGMNDVIHGPKGISLEQYETNMKSIVTQCRAAGIRVMLFTTTTAGQWDSPQSRQLGRYSDVVRHLARQNQCALADLYNVFVENLKAADTLRGLTGDGVHMTPEGNLLIASTVLETFGLNEVQLTKARESWLDLPDAGTVSTRVDVELNKKFFTATCPLTLRERERLLAVAAAEKRPTLGHWSKELLLSLMERKVKPAGPFESLDALFAPESKGRVQRELQAEFVAEVEKLIR